MDTPIKHAERIRIEDAMMTFFQAPRATVRKRFNEIAAQVKAQQQVQAITQSVKDYAAKVETQELKPRPVGGGGGSGGPTSAPPAVSALARHTFIFNDNGVARYWSIPSEYIGDVP